MDSPAGRTTSALAKVARISSALRHQQGDRIPIGEFFWGGFVKRWRDELQLPADADPYSYYDLDWIVTTPNMDPHIQAFDTIREDAEEVVVRTGFAATLRKRFDLPMPEPLGWETDSIDKLESFEFDDPRDRRRFCCGGDNQIAGVGDSFARNSPPWIEGVRSFHRNMAVFGSVIEASECLTRLVGQQNTMLWIGLHPDRLGRQIERIGEFYCRLAEAQIQAAGGLLDGMVIWGDVAYRNGMFFSPDYWRAHFKPCVKAVIDLCHRHGLPVIYHGCGNVTAILGDFIEMGLDAYNPLEVKAGLDVVALRRRHGHDMGFCGNSNIQVWEQGDRGAIRREVLRKLNAAKGGGYLFQSDHSVTSAVSGRTYDYIIKLVRQFGTYPLDLGQFDESV